MSASTINISLPDTMKADVEEIIATEGYGNTSEFFWERVHNDMKRRQERKIEELLLERLNSGKATPLTKGDIEKIKERGLQRLKNKAR